MNGVLQLIDFLDPTGRLQLAQLALHVLFYVDGHHAAACEAGFPGRTPTTLLGQ
jgi:hypothetical protein